MFTYTFNNSVCGNTVIKNHMNKKHIVAGVPVTAMLVLSFVLTTSCALAQTPPAKGNDVTAPLHLMKPDYPTPYGKPAMEDITKVLNRVFSYLDTATPPKLINNKTKAEITDLKLLNSDAVLVPGDFRLISYEWGVTYAGMLLAGTATGDKRFTDYTAKRLKLIADITPYYRAQQKANAQSPSPVRSILEPHALDDAGAMCAAMIKASRTGIAADLRPLIDNFITYITTKEFRLADGTLARNRPQPNTLWLDDMFMSVPALAQMGKLTGDRKYFDDAVKQVLQFSQRMFNKEKGVYMHGWVQGMSVHPQYHWARANGWAVMTMVELLDVLPADHPGYNAVLEQLRAHIKGLARFPCFINQRLLITVN